MKTGLNSTWSTIVAVSMCICILGASKYVILEKNYPLAAVLIGYALIKLVSIAQGSVRDSIRRKRLLVSLRKWHGYALNQSDWDILNNLIIKNHH